MISPEEFSGTLITETEKAILVDFEVGEEIWLPLSQVEFRVDDEDKCAITVTMPMWLAKEKGLV